MRFTPFTVGRILDRRKRFLADCELPDGSRVVAHLANTGRMTGCWEPGAPVRLSWSDNPKRKLRWSVEQVRMRDHWILVNTARPNALVAEALADGRIPELASSGPAHRERPFPDGGRVDFLIETTPPTWVEVKSATLARGDTVVFPDTVTTRGLAHLHALADRSRAGERAVLLLLVGTSAGTEVRPAHDLDPAWAEAVERLPIEVLAYRAELSEDEMRVGGPVPFRPGVRPAVP